MTKQNRIMKRIINLSLYLLSAVVLLNSCRKEDNSKIPELVRFPLPKIVKDAGSDQVIDASDPHTFTGKFTVGLYHEGDAPPSKYDVVVIKNEDKSIVKTITPNVTTFPTSITITGAQLETLFGSPIVVGDKFDISVDVTTQSGKKYLAFPITGEPYAAGIAAQPNSSTRIRYEAVCQYDADIYQGNFIVIEDGWDDYDPGDIVPLTKIDATHFSFEYAAANPKPIVVTVNPTTNEVSVAKQIYGSGYPPGWTFGDISAESVPNINNFVAPCEGTFSVVLKHTVAAGNFGEFRIYLRKE